MNNTKSARRIFAVCVLLGACLLLASPAAAVFSGSGTEESPYLIQSEDDMRTLSEQVDAGSEELRGAWYLLTTDLVLSGEWKPVGLSKAETFYGVFDGNGKSVRYTIANPDTPYAGLFGSNSGTIRNLVVEAEISGICAEEPLTAGGVAGMNFHGTIENCRFTTKITAEKVRCAGGVVGYDSAGIIRGCSGTADISVQGSITEDVKAGGVVGETTGDVFDCAVLGTVFAEGRNWVYAGGISGCSMNGQTAGCTAEADVGVSGSGENLYAGGVAGENHGFVERCAVKESAVSAVFNGAGQTFVYAGGLVGRNYAAVYGSETAADVSSDVSGIRESDMPRKVSLGGAVGQNEESGEVSSCTVYGLVSAAGTDDVFSDTIVGKNYGTVSDCSFDAGRTAVPESPLPLFGMVLGGLCALVLRRE